MTLTHQDLHLAIRFAGLDLDADESRIHLRETTASYQRNGNYLMGALFGVLLTHIFITWTVHT